MKAFRIFAVFAGLLLIFGYAWTTRDPCWNYRGVLQYARSSDSTVVSLKLVDKITEAAIELAVPRAFVRTLGNMSSGSQCAIHLQMFWPSMTSSGHVDEREARILAGKVGDRQLWKSLTIDVWISRDRRIESAVPAGYCYRRARRVELADRPFGLRGFDDGTLWPGYRDKDGTVRSGREYATYPLNKANEFFYIDRNIDDMIWIRCGQGAARCNLHDRFNGFATKTFFNADDLENWRNYRDTVRSWLKQHLVGVWPAEKAIESGLHVNPPSAYVACMREMEEIAGPRTQHRMSISGGRELRISR